MTKVFCVAIFIIVISGVGYLALSNDETTPTNRDEFLRMLYTESILHYAKGIRLLESNDYFKAIEQFDIVIYISKYIDDSKPASSYSGRGQAKVMLGHYDYAIPDFDTAIQLNPKDDTAYLSRGFAKHNLKRYGEAIRDFDACIRLKPDDSIAYYYRAGAYFQNHDYSSAIRDFDVVIRLDPSDCAGYLGRGLTKFRLGKIEDAKQDALMAKKYSLEEKNKEYRDTVNNLLKELDMLPAR